MVKIEKNRPIPETAAKTKQGKYPWSTMEIGDSFLVNIRQLAFGSLANYNARMRRLKQRQIKIETHKEGDKCRVWRIK